MCTGWSWCMLYMYMLSVEIYTASGIGVYKLVGRTSIINFTISSKYIHHILHDHVHTAAGLHTPRPSTRFNYWILLEICHGAAYMLLCCTCMQHRINGVMYIYHVSIRTRYTYIASCRSVSAMHFIMSLLSQSSCSSRATPLCASSLTVAQRQVSSLPPSSGTWGKLESVVSRPTQTGQGQEQRWHTNADQTLKQIQSL